MKERIRDVLRGLGIELGGYRHTYLARRQRLFSHYGIDLLVDVGANDGRYVTAARRAGYRGEVLSFEPASIPFATLAAEASADGRWQVKKTAVGAKSGEIVLNLSADPLYSSAVEVLDAATAVDPAAGFVGTESVPLETLDALLGGYQDRMIGVKIDVQGLERAVFTGGEHTLGQAKLVEVEMSPLPIYGGNQMLMPEMIDYLAGRGLILALTENVFPNHATGQSLQFNGLFLRIQAATTRKP